MKPIVLTESIAAPPELVFDRCTDIPSTPDYIAAIETIEMLTDGPIGVGSRFRETRIMMGKHASEEMTVTAIDPPRSWTLEAHSHGTHYLTTTTFTPSSGGTRLEMSFTGTPQSMSAKILGACLGWMMVGYVRKALQQDLADLKAACEASINS
ncbi:MAG: SRPBCC family protein [Planctomycetota bacterium]